MKSENRACLDAGDDQTGNEIACPHMHDVRLLDEIGDGEAHDQGPVESPHEGIPDHDLRSRRMTNSLSHHGLLLAPLPHALSSIKVGHASFTNRL
jgi:hypothetical protein